MNEDEKKAIEKLKERVKIDRQLRGKVESDFDKFCEDECISIETVLNLIDKQNKVIDKESEQLAGLTIWNNNKEEPLILGNKEEVKKYYFRKVEKDE